MKEQLTWYARFSSLRAWFCSVHEKRSYNTLRYPMTNRLLMMLYPIFIVCMAELNQDKYPSKLVLFITNHPTIMLFNVLIAALIFIGALLLFKSGWFSCCWKVSCIWLSVLRNYSSTTPTATT